MRILQDIAQYIQLLNVLQNLQLLAVPPWTSAVSHQELQKWLLPGAFKRSSRHVHLVLTPATMKVCLHLLCCEHRFDLGLAASKRPVRLQVILPPC